MTHFDRLLRAPDVCRRIGLSRATLYRLEGRGAFPRRIHVTDCAVRWSERAVTNWIDDRTMFRKAA